MSGAFAFTVEHRDPALEIQEVTASVAAEQLRAIRFKESAPARAKARESIDNFIEYAMTDPHRGSRPIIQGRHHRRIQEVFREHKRVVLKFPVEHGKTTQAKFLLLSLLGEHPDRCYAYLQAKKEKASEVVGACKREIESNEKIRAIYPNLRPQMMALQNTPELWGTTRFRVRGCPPGSKDPSLAAYGLDGQILGSRLHGVVMDNILTRANTASREQRKKVLELIDNEILTRVLEDEETGEEGFAIILDTTWFIDDAVEVIARRKGWHVETFDAEVGLVPEDDTLWPSQFSMKRLNKIRSTMPESSYYRMYRNKPLNEASGHFRDDVLDPCWGVVPWVAPVEGERFDWSSVEDEENGIHVDKACISVDLATRKGEEHDQTVITVQARIGHRYRLFYIVSDKLDGLEIARAIVPVWRYFFSDADFTTAVVVEDNAAQKYIVDMFKDAAVMKALDMTDREIDRITVEGFTTTVKKRDLEIGVPGLSGDFEMRRYQVPDHEETDRLRDGLKAWTPEGHTADHVMSLWIGREWLRPDEPDVYVVE